MSAKSWLEEFYPKTARDVARMKLDAERKAIEATAHSLQKWKGLTANNLIRHGCKIESGNVFDCDYNLVLAINSESCALCACYSCDECPLKRYLSYTCDANVGEDEIEDIDSDDVPWLRWDSARDPTLMISCLEGTLSMLSEELKPLEPKRKPKKEPEPPEPTRKFTKALTHFEPSNPAKKLGFCPNCISLGSLVNGQDIYICFDHLGETTPIYVSCYYNRFTHYRTMNLVCTVGPKCNWTDAQKRAQEIGLVSIDGKPINCLPHLLLGKFAKRTNMTCLSEAGIVCGFSDGEYITLHSTSPYHWHGSGPHYAPNRKGRNFYPKSIEIYRPETGEWIPASQVGKNEGA